MEDERFALDALLAVSERLAREAPLEDAAGLCGRLASICNARSVALYAIEDTAGEAALRGGAGLPSTYLDAWPVGVRTPFSSLAPDVGRAMSVRSSVILHALDGPTCPPVLRALAQEGGFSSSFAAPLCLDSELVGAVHAFFGDTGDVHRVELLASMLPLLAGAVERDRLRTAVRSLQRSLAEASTPPPTTGLYARTQIDRALRHVHAAAGRYGGSYSVVVYALDHGQVLLRRYGEDLVARAVAQLAAAISAECRDADHPGYVDATTCLVVLPSTGEDGAFTHCERTLGRFAEMPFRVGPNRLELTASAGISCFPENGAADGLASVAAAHHALQMAVAEDAERVIAVSSPNAAQ